MKTYKTYEAIEILNMDSEKIFKTEASNGTDKFLYCDRKSIRCTQNAINLKLYITDEWELVQEPVTFMEAVRAFKCGKSIKSVCGKNPEDYSPNKYNFMEITPDEILDGKWFIEEDNINE